MKHKEILPEFPKIQHLPWKPNLGEGDTIAEEVSIIFESPYVCVEEKVDGSFCGISLYEKHPVIRNRNRFLKKSDRNKNFAQKQFNTIWNWFYKNKKLFEKINTIAGTVSVYGEWMYAQHGIEYNKLPSLFIAYDLYDYEKKRFLEANESIRLLNEAGFSTPPILTNSIDNYEQLEELTKQPSPFTNKAMREGIVIKVSKDGKYNEVSYKMIREDFKQGELWASYQLNQME